MWINSIYFWPAPFVHISCNNNSYLILTSWLCHYLVITYFTNLEKNNNTFSCSFKNQFRQSIECDISPQAKHNQWCPFYTRAPTTMHTYTNKNRPIDVGSFESNIIFRHPITGKRTRCFSPKRVQIDDWLTFFRRNRSLTSNIHKYQSSPTQRNLTMPFVYPYSFTWIAFSAHQYVARKLKVGYVGNRQFRLNSFNSLLYFFVQASVTIYIILGW